MKYKPNFLDRTIPINQIEYIESLLLKKIDIAQSPRGFQVLALPGKEVVYWSFSRKKVNTYIKSLIETKNIMASYDDSIKIKSLDYDHRYTPNEYLFGFSLYLIFFIFLVLNNYSYSEFFPMFLILLSTYSLYKYIFSNIQNNALTNSSSGTDNP